MTRRSKSVLLYLTAVLLALLAAFGVTLAVKLPYASAQLQAPLQRSQAANQPASSVPPLEDFAPLWQRPLRSPLYDAPLPLVSLDAAPPPPLNLRLAGTIIEPGRNRAMMVTPDGRTHFMRVGDRRGEAELLSIDLATVTINYHGQQVVLKINRENGGK